MFSKERASKGKEKKKKKSDKSSIDPNRPGKDRIASNLFCLEIKKNKMNRVQTLCRREREKHAFRACFVFGE